MHQVQIPQYVQFLRYLRDMRLTVRALPVCLCILQLTVGAATADLKDDMAAERNQICQARILRLSSCLRTIFLPGKDACCIEAVEFNNAGCFWFVHNHPPPPLIDRVTIRPSVQNLFDKMSRSGAVCIIVDNTISIPSTSPRQPSPCVHPTWLYSLGTLIAS